MKKLSQVLSSKKIKKGGNRAIFGKGGKGNLCGKGGVKGKASVSAPKKKAVKIGKSGSNLKGKGGRKGGKGKGVMIAESDD